MKVRLKVADDKVETAGDPFVRFDKTRKILKILKSERPFYEKCENQDTMDASVFGQSKINKGKIDQLTIS